MRVVRAGPIINITGDLFTSDDGWNASLDFGRGFREHGYLLSSRNELVVFGCNVMATLSADVVGEETTKIVSGCASLYFLQKLYGKERYCTGTSRCCVASLISGGVPKAAQVRWLYSGNHTFEQTQEPVTVFVTPYGWIDDLAQWVDGFKEVPLLLEFGVKPALPQGSMTACTQDVQRMVCKSEHSSCQAWVHQGYTCYCDHGYDGNPYLAGGCQG